MRYKISLLYLLLFVVLIITQEKDVESSAVSSFRSHMWTTHSTLNISILLKSLVFDIW